MVVSQVNSFEQAKQSKATAKKCASNLSDFTPTSHTDTEEMKGGRGEVSNRQCFWSVDNCVALDKQCFCSHSLNCAHVFLFVRAQRLHCPVFKVFTLRKYERGISRSSTRQVVHADKKQVL